MEVPPAHTVVADPALPWPKGQGCPYEYLREQLRRRRAKLIGPDSPAAAIEDASFDLMTREDREVLDEIRLLPRRLLVDFFLYEVPGIPPEPLAAWLAELPMPLPPVPVEAVLARAVPPLAGVPPPAPAPTGPARSLIVPALPPTPPLDLGPLPTHHLLLDHHAD